MRFKLLFLFILVVITCCTPEREKHSSLLNYIPHDAAFVLKINDFEAFENDIAENEIISQLKSTLPFQKISKNLSPLNYLIDKTEGLLAIFEGVDSDFDFIYIPSDSTSNLQFDTLTDRKIELFTYKNFELKKHQIETTVFYSSIIDHKEILGSSELVLKNLIGQIDNPKPKPRLEKLYGLSNASKVGHAWVNLSKSDTLIKRIFNTYGDISLSRYADWLSLDITIENDGLFLNGLSIAQDSLHSYLGLFSNTKPLPNTTSSLAPANTSSYTSYTFNEFKAFTKNRQNYLDIEAPADSLLNAVEEIGIAQIAQEGVVFLKTFGTANVTDYLKSIQNGSIDFQGGEILELRQNNLIETNFNPLVPNFEAKFCYIIENTFVFSETLETLEKVIGDYKSDNILEKTTFFQNASEVTTQESTMLSLADLNGFQDILKENGLSNLAKDLGKSNLKNHLFGSQIVAEDNFLHTSYFIKKISNLEEKSGVTSSFKVQIESQITSSPQFVTNHRTNRKEIVIQDEDNVLYLISTKGKILWKKQLPGPIQGKIHQVDIYKNKKLQLAFTTDNEFMILDRNGKEVQPFSIKHEGGNLNPLAVFDYERNKDYRFVVTQGNKVFMYNNKGKIVDGFKYKEAEQTILNAPQHFRIGQKDYLVFKLSNGILKILNRVGNVRVNVSEKISFSENAIKLHKTKITLTSDKGILYQIDTQGKITKTDLNLNPDHGMDATSKTLAIINDNILKIRDKKVALELGVYSQPAIFYLNDKIYVSVTDIQNQKSYLFDSQAESIPNFPIFGTSDIDMADMDNDKKPELVVQDQDNVITVYSIK